MKPNKVQNRKLNLNKQTIQRLDIKSASEYYAGNQEAAANTDTLPVSIIGMAETSATTPLATAIIGGACIVSLWA